MRKEFITLSFGLAFLFANASAMAWDREAPGKMGKLPDLTKSCAKECPDAKNNQEAMSCVDKMETSQGEKAFKKEHKSCYNAHEKYEKKMGKQEAGEMADDHY